MVPTGRCWNIMKLQCEGCVPDRKGQRRLMHFLEKMRDFMKYHVEFCRAVK